MNELLMLAVPMLVAGVRKASVLFKGRFKKSVPKPLYLVAAWAIAGILTGFGEQVGIQLPTDLANYDEATVGSFLMNTTVLAGAGVFFRELYDQTKKMITN